MAEHRRRGIAKKSTPVETNPPLAAERHPSVLTAVEQSLIDQYRRLNDVTQEAVRRLVSALPAFELNLSDERSDASESARPEANGQRNE